MSYSSNYVNAFWDGTRMTYGDGDGVNYGPLVSADITGHEITHGVTEYSANLVYQRESGALNESFSDIFGEMIEFHATGSNDWQMGTDIGIGGSGAIRSMNNPNLYGDPDTYGGSNWYNPNCGTPTQFNDYCGVHTNSGVQNKWFYILAAGESARMTLEIAIV
ncbi:MAG: M4 family metallopeptidase [Bacteroidia bacterium]